MRIYSASSEETLRARRLLREWVVENFLTSEEYGRLEQETVSELRTTNIFLRLVLLLFTLISVGAAVGLFVMVFLSHPSNQTIGIVLLIFAVICYAAAETLVYQAKLYRYGIEEALALCAVAFLCAGMQAIFFSGYSTQRDSPQFLVPAAGAVFSLWIWRRFGLWYAFPAAMIFALFLPGYWTSSHPAQHVIVALFYTTGLIGVAAVRSRHRFDYLDESYSLAEAFLWFGIYLAINLKLSSLSVSGQWWTGGTSAASEFPRPFYWGTWILIWLLPPVVLVRGIRRKDRFVIAAGAVAVLLTFVSNKPYLGWQRHTWDPMILGILLTGVALFVRRWLSNGPNGIRRGFTAARLSGKDQRWMNVGSAAMAFVSPQSITPDPQASSPEFRFGGGASGGGGSSADF